MTKNIHKIPHQTKCPVCGAVRQTPEDVYVDWENGEYDYFCDQCGSTSTILTQKWDVFLRPIKSTDDKVYG